MVGLQATCPAAFDAAVAVAGEHGAAHGAPAASTQVGVVSAQVVLWRSGGGHDLVDIVAVALPTALNANCFGLVMLGLAKTQLVTVHLNLHN